MERPLWDRIQEIYYLTLPVIESERDEFVDRACGSDQLLVREVSSLLEADKTSGDFLQATVFELGLRIISSNSAENPEGPGVDLSADFVGSTVDGRYLVEKKLGHGGIGTVYLARDLSLHNRPVVIKILSDASLQDPYVVKKFRQEVEALARIDHPGVVSVLSAGRLADGKPYIGMQYIKGVTLRSQITNEGMDFERAAAILKQVGEALDDVHEKGIFHRDLKPENIMLQTLKSGTELVKIVDFGIAKVKDSVVAPSTVNEAPVGTVLYMSPEQLRAEKVTALSDIYSLAVIAYEMATGRRPFNPASGPQLLEMHRAGVRVKPVDLRSGLSTEAQAIILRGLSFEPKDRYQDASEFGNHLARALTNEGKTAWPAKQQDAAEFRSLEPTKVVPPNTVSNTVQAAMTPAPGTPPLTKSGDTAEQSTATERRGWFSSTRMKFAVSGFLILLCVAVLLSVYMFRTRQQAITSTRTPRSFTYWLTVQKVRDGKSYQEPFQSSGQEIFENGYKFRLNVGGPDPGYLYVFNEGPPDEDGTTFTIIYPTRSKSGRLSANQPVQTNWNTFRGQAGTENFWIIWSVDPIDRLESAKTRALENPKGALADVDAINVKEFVTSHSSPEVTSTKDPTTQTTNVRGLGNVLVQLAKLEHR